MVVFSGGVRRVGQEGVDGGWRCSNRFGGVDDGRWHVLALACSARPTADG